MADAQTIEDALASVEYPLLGRTIGELGMVDSVEKGRLGAATVSLKVPFVGHPSDELMQDAIKHALGEVGGVRSVKVDVREMTDAEQAEAMGAVTAKVPGVVAPGSQTRVISVSSG
ncbi:MAG: DUF59 domain-containing protein, partial [Acidimicrobiia bacterium]|nr:DUF59 domain-containing protein [Acidimicrobiia bacterium]